MSYFFYFGCIFVANLYDEADRKNNKRKDTRQGPVYRKQSGKHKKTLYRKLWVPNEHE